MGIGVPLESGEEDGPRMEGGDREEDWEYSEDAWTAIGYPSWNAWRK